MTTTAPRKARTSSRKKKRCFYFGARKTDGKASQKILLGGKGANLADMTSIGLPVPPGFTITTETCADFSRTGKLPAGLMDEVKRNVTLLEKELGKKSARLKDEALVDLPGSKRAPAL